VIIINRKSKNKQHNDQWKKDRQHNDQWKKDRQHNDQWQKDRQHNDQWQKDKQWFIKLRVEQDEHSLLGARVAQWVR
jgi:hypothetical protein